MADEKIKEASAPIVIRGIGVGSGIAIAPLRFDPMGGTVKENLLLLERGAEGARRELLALREQAVKEVGDEHGEVFDLHLSMLSDSELMKFLESRIESGDSLKAAIDGARERFSKLDGKDRSERAMAAHAREVLELLRESADEAEKEESVFSGESCRPFEKYILVSFGGREDFIFAPDAECAVGIVSVGGSENSGLAAFARAKGIPALVVDEADAPDVKYEGWGAIIDPVRNRLTVNPDLAALDKFTESSRISEEKEQRLAELIGKPSVTRGGSYISVLATVDSGEGAAALSADAEGIGIMRTEHLFNGSEDLKEIEKRNFEEYKRTFEIFKGKPVTVRTYAGGRGSEMGQRGIRFCLARREFFKSQIRAMLRASALGELYIALPMAVSPEEIRRARAVIAEAAAELKGEGAVFGEPGGVGAVIDTPAAAVNAERLAAESDFFIADTDRLLSFTLAADRRDADVSELIKRNPDPVMKLMEYSAKALHASGKGKLFGVAGDLAADTSLTESLISLGIDFLSVSPPYVLEIREKIRECP